MKRFWGLRSFMEISDFISSVRPEQLASSGFKIFYQDAKK